jgi:hypothetical protein
MGKFKVLLTLVSFAYPLLISEDIEKYGIEYKQKTSLVYLKISNKKLLY